MYSTSLDDYNHHHHFNNNNNNNNVYSIRQKYHPERNGKNRQVQRPKIQRMWQMKTEGIPVIVGALGTIKKGMVENIKRVIQRELL